MRANLMALLATAALGAGCSGDETTSERNVRFLDDHDGDGLMEEEDPGGVIMPDPGDCPVMEYSETHTVTVDSDGNIISETYEVCVQCLAEDGTEIGDEVCYDEPPLPPEVYCEEYDSGDPTLSCYYCVDAAGMIIIDECWPLPVECATDADCPMGQICYVYDDMAGGTLGYCGHPDPCVSVPSLPSDPTGESCWVCTDPETGADWGSWCDVHVCAPDGSCVNPWEVCDPSGSGYCIYDDPCDPVASLPEDPTGTDCYRCTDPVTGDDWGGWCNVHTCTTDDDCAPRGEVCNEDLGLCEWVDPCTPVASLPSDPTGFDCYQCTDPVTGDDWGGWCNSHACETDADCLDSGWGDSCAGSVCVFAGCPDPSGGMGAPGMD